MPTSRLRWGPRDKRRETQDENVHPERGWIRPTAETPRRPWHDPIPCGWPNILLLCGSAAVDTLGVRHEEVTHPAHLEEGKAKSAVRYPGWREPVRVPRPPASRLFGGTRRPGRRAAGRRACSPTMARCVTPSGPQTKGIHEPYVLPCGGFRKIRRPQTTKSRTRRRRRCCRLVSVISPAKARPLGDLEPRSFTAPRTARSMLVSGVNSVRRQPQPLQRCLPARFCRAIDRSGRLWRRMRSLDAESPWSAVKEQKR